MSSRLRTFFVISLIIHLILLTLFSYRPVEKNPLQPLQVEFSLNSDTVNKSLSSRSDQINVSKNKLRKVHSSSTSVPEKKQNFKQSSENKFKNDQIFTSKRKLVKNDPPPVNRDFQDTIDNRVNDERINRRLTLEKSTEITRGGYNLGESNNEDDTTTSGDDENSLFDTKSVLGGDANHTGKSQAHDFDLKSLGKDGTSAKGSASSGKNSRDSKDGAGSGLSWKKSGQRTLLSKDDLSFPQKLQGRGIDEEVVVGFKVNPDGKVYDIELLKSSGFSELDTAVKEQVRSFRFNAIQSKTINEAEYSYLFRLAHQ